jgi:hypothetical protein
MRAIQKNFGAASNGTSASKTTIKKFLPTFLDRKRTKKGQTTGMNYKHLQLLVTSVMPYGMYQGQSITDLVAHHGPGRKIDVLPSLI